MPNRSFLYKIEREMLLHSYKSWCGKVNTHTATGLDRIWISKALTCHDATGVNDSILFTFMHPRRSPHVIQKLTLILERSIPQGLLEPKGARRAHASN